jgi:hypothetical protein
MPRQKWPARWCGRLGGALRYIIRVNNKININTSKSDYIEVLNLVITPINPKSKRSGANRAV